MSAKFISKQILLPVFMLFLERNYGKLRALFQPFTEKELAELEKHLKILKTL